MPDRVIAQEENDLSKFYGNWNGAGIQEKKYVWKLQIIFSEQTRKVNFINLKCQGTFTVLNSTGEDLEIEYTIHSGSTCTKTATLKLTRIENNTLSFIWYEPNGRPAGKGLLAK